MKTIGFRKYVAINTILKLEVRKFGYEFFVRIKKLRVLVVLEIQY